MRIVKMKGGVFLVMLAIMHSVFGQQLLPVVLDTSLVERQILFTGGAFHHSTALTNKFTNRFLLGGEISRETAEEVWKKHKDYNRLGLGYQFRVEYRDGASVSKKKEHWSWMVEASNELHAAAAYSDELMGLAFLGNEPFLGERLTLSGTTAEFIQFFSIGGGVHDKKTKSFMTLNLILPQNFFELEVKKAFIEFGNNGESITADLEGQLRTADKRPFFKGLGAALNFDFNIPFGKEDGFNGVFALTARNLGFYAIRNADLARVKTKKSFAGFELNDFFAEEGMALEDSIKVIHTTKTRYKMLPGFFQVGKVVTNSEAHKIQSFFGVRMYATNPYRPLIYAGAHYRPITKFAVGAQGAYGGYGNFRLGLYLNYIGDNIVVSAGSEDLLGLILNGQYGQSALIRLTWKL